MIKELRQHMSRRDGLFMAAKENKKKSMLMRKFEALPKKTQKTITYALIGVLALVVILLILNAVDILPHMDGSLNVVGGKLAFADDNALIINVDSRDNPRYYSIGHVEIPAGYYDDESLTFKSDKLTTDFTLRLEDNSEMPWFNYVAITGCTESPEKRLESAYSLTAVTDDEGNTTYSEQFTASSAQKGYQLTGYIYGGETKDEYSGKYNRYCLAYMPTNREDTCIMVNIIASRERRMTLPTDEEMMAVLCELADIISLD